MKTLLKKPESNARTTPRLSDAARSPNAIGGRSAGAAGEIQLPWLRVCAALVLAGAFVWCYWPTFGSLVDAWLNVPDYSHGFLVVPLAVYFAWARRSRMPAFSPHIQLGGLILIAVSVAMRIFGASIHWEAFDGWSMVPWIAGTVWMLAGWRVLGWSLPSIVFLVFMVPAPYRIERWLSYPLQTVATQASCWILQVLGQPAFPEGNTILFGDYHLEVAEACCGLRIFIGIVALGYAFVVLVRSSWWLRCVVLLSVLPVALASNVTRIVATALLYQYVSGETAQKFAHDAAGWLTIPLAAILFLAVSLYFGSLIRQVEVADVRTILRRQKA